jgi:hypothetical protein
LHVDAGDVAHDELDRSDPIPTEPKDTAFVDEAAEMERLHVARQMEVQERKLR